ncbi:hypothetical protein SMM50_005162 [Salmonella enterica]|nr:hypothetical protein [Salmonella enterica]
MKQLVERLGTTAVKLTEAEVKSALTQAASNGTQSMDVPSRPFAGMNLPVVINSGLQQ